MGNSKSKPEGKFNKNHITKKGFQFGLSFGREDLTMEGNIQIGWTNKTVKNYSVVENSLKDVEKPCLQNVEKLKINDDNEISNMDPND